MGKSAKINKYQKKRGLHQLVRYIQHIHFGYVGPDARWAYPEYPQIKSKHFGKRWNEK